MNVIPKPSYTDQYAPIPNQKVAMLICLPDSYTPAKKFPWKVMAHGMGGRGPGTMEALYTVFSGAFQTVTEDWKKMVDTEGVIGVIVNYNNFFQPADWDWVYDYMIANYNVESTFLGEGFSWGGGSLQKYYCTPKGATRLACAIPIAPTIEGGITEADWANVGKANLPVCIMVNARDDNGPTNLSVTQKSVAAINKSNPAIRATYIAFDKSGHGGIESALAERVPGALENADQWYKSILANGRRQIKLGTSTIPVPEQPSVPGQFKAVASFTLDGNTVKLIGNKSVGFVTGYEGVWSLEAGPASVTQKEVFQNRGSSFINATAVLPKPGTYTFKLSLVKGQLSDYATVTIVYGEQEEPVRKTVKSFHSVNQEILYSDGSKETGFVVYENGLWKLTNSKGEEVPW